MEKRILTLSLVQISSDGEGSALIGIKSLNYQAVCFEYLLRRESGEDASAIVTQK